MPGKIGRFNIGRTLGSGATCKAKLAVDTETGRQVAVKILNGDMSENDKKMITDEVEALQAFKHKNVLTMFEVGHSMYEKKNKSKSREVDYIVLEICSGGELFDFVAESGPFSEPVARFYVKQILEGLEHVH